MEFCQGELIGCNEEVIPTGHLREPRLHDLID